VPGGYALCGVFAAGWRLGSGLGLPAPKGRRCQGPVAQPPHRHGYVKPGAVALAEITELPDTARRC